MRVGGMKRWMDGWMAERMDEWMDRWRFDVWKEVCYILPSIHRRAHQRQCDIYGAVDCGGLPSAAGTESRDIVNCAEKTVAALDYH